MKGNGAIDVLAERPGEKVAVEVETGKSNIKANLNKIEKAGFDRIILVATSATAITSCQKVIDTVNRAFVSKIELLNWLDIS